MTATPEPPEGDSESWDQMAQRVTAEVVNTTYANSLMDAMQAYRAAGFSDAQSFELVKHEHRSRLEHMTMLAIANVQKGSPESP